MASKPTKIILAVPLCFRGMAAWEEKIPVDATVEERHRVTLAQYRNKLKTETHVVPDPVSLKSGWIGESIPDKKSGHLYTIWTLPNTLKKIACQIAYFID